MICVERLEAMRELHRSGWTLQRIGIAFDLSRERVRQILDGAGITKHDGGRTVLSIENRKRLLRGRSDKAERRTRITYGCSRERAIELNGGRNLSDHTSKAYFYGQQRKNAKCHRGIVWAMTFEEWCKLWDNSGKWDQRGRGKDKFCMARIADSGPYSAENVEIITNSRNASDSYLITSGQERAFKAGRRRDELGFSPAQRRVYDLLLAGLNNRAIAAQLNVTGAVVAQYKCQILRMRPIAA
jgi:hypothetical protein